MPCSWAGDAFSKNTDFFVFARVVLDIREVQLLKSARGGVAAAFGQTESGQNHNRPKSTGRIWPIFVGRIWPDRIWPFFVFGGMVGGPKGWGARRVGGPKFHAFFSLSRRKLHSFLPLWGLLVEFWWCLKRRGAQMCTFGVLGLSCEGRRGFTRQPENSKRAHLSAPALQTPPKFNEKTPQERRKNEIFGGREKKKSEISEGGP